MKKSEIKIGEKYAYKLAGVVRPAIVVRPDKPKHPTSKARGRWIVMLDPEPGRYETPIERTRTALSAQLVAPWSRYCVDAAHDAAKHEDRSREREAEYEAERAEFRRAFAPIADAFRGVMVPAEGVSSGNFDRPDRDLGEWLHETFIDQGASGASVGYEVWEAVGRALIEAREAALNAGGGWGPGPTDTGIAVVDTPTPPEARGPSLAGLQRFARG